ncbi:tyrosine--tRNA ligase [uncultured Imperialibacter sp.]|uniref:tyrosine--tRNA ligase n=1 Tax=uncultured Imperialibacter sp. TaxID=1672639 RepID=UPI0030DB819D|tara:strand:+ start:9529 stop:10815 length:1287 start_codon:yes stop_codon:yes gene_type:complete
MIDFIEELKWRGMLNDMMPGTEEQLKKEMTSAYIGFDPTAASLHIGNLATIMLLVHFQRAGHKPYALVGGATGMIGDPSGKSEERNLLDEGTLRKNQEGIKVQLEKFLAFDSGKNAAVMVNNYDWFKKFGFLEFLRDAGKHITVNYMMAKDSVKNRLETGLSFTEFSYQLLQGYDFYHLYTEHQVKLQMGGSDQWGNITTGTEFIRRKASGEAYALTTPLVTKADGTKFGKSEGGNVWLDPEMTSPYKFYQFWLNCSDDDSHRLIRVFTLLGKNEIEKLEKEHAEAPHLRIMQQAIAKDVTTRVHSEADYNMAVKASGILFGKDVTAELEEIDEKTLLQVFEGVPMVEISRTTLDNAATITDLLSTETNSEIFSSKGEVRKMIQQGGVSINKIKVSDPNEKPAYKLLQGKYLLCQKGKKNYYLIKVGS